MDIKLENLIDLIESLDGIKCVGQSADEDYKAILYRNNNTGIIITVDSSDEEVENRIANFYLTKLGYADIAAQIFPIDESQE